MTGQPTMRLLSLGAGVQSTTLLLLAAEGRLGPLHGAIFSDTGWEPRAVYEHLDRLEREVAAARRHPAGFPCQDVSLAGRRAGIAEGTRSGLWAHIAHAIHALQPQLVVIRCSRGWVGRSAGL